MPRIALVAVLFFAVCVLPLASVHPAVLVLLGLPLVAAVAVLRTGVDVDADGVVAQALLRRVRTPWAEVAGVRVAPDNRLWLVRTDRAAVRLPLLRASDLPRLHAASGGRLGIAAAPHPGAAPESTP